jgi:toxin secretion/phage lysis holin
MIDRLNSLALGKWITAFGVAMWIHTPDPLRILTLLLIVDYLTGLAAAWSRKEVSSDVGRRGLTKKLGILGLVLMLYGAEWYLRRAVSAAGTALPLWAQIPAANSLALGYCVNEAISVIENFSWMGVPIPAAWVRALMAAKKLRLEAATEEDLRKLEASGE